MRFAKQWLVLKLKQNKKKLTIKVVGTRSVILISDEITKLTETKMKSFKYVVLKYALGVGIVDSN